MTDITKHDIARMVLKTMREMSVGHVCADCGNKAEVTHGALFYCAKCWMKLFARRTG